MRLGEPTGGVVGAPRRAHRLVASAIALLTAGVAAGGLGVLSPRPVAAASSLGLASVPYMGWNTYYGQVRMNDANIRAEAQAIHDSGLEQAGYKYVWLDGGWWNGTRDGSGQITVDPVAWPNGMAPVASYIHSLGLLAGIYTDAGQDGCAGAGSHQGSYGHYQQDANTFAAWGYDAVKVDFCGGHSMGLDPATAYGQFSQALLNDTPARAILFNICNPFIPPGASFAKSGWNSFSFGPSDANSWRTNTDIGFGGSIQWSDVIRNLDADAAHPVAAGPGHWNDPDYLGPDLGMTASQAQAQFTMWSMLAAPLIIGSSVTPVSSTGGGTTLGLSPTSLAMLKNSAVIAIDQDPLGKQATPLSYGVQGIPTGAVAAGLAQVWVKPLANGDRAVALLNRSHVAVSIGTTAAGLGLPVTSSYTVNNLWSGTQSSTSGGISATVPAGSALLYRISPVGTPSSQTDCTWNGGTYLCQYGISGPYNFPDNTQEYWVVAPDRTVSTRWSDRGGAWHWSNLGGSVSSVVSFSGTNWSVDVCALAGSGPTVWCDNRGDALLSGWSGWYDTGPVEPTDTSQPVETSCSWNGGSYYCQYGIVGPHRFADGTVQYWVIGGSNQVWTYWNDTGGVRHWSGLGGGLFSSVSYTATSDGWGITIYAWYGYGNGGQQYCNTRPDQPTATWGGWYRC